MSDDLEKAFRGAQTAIDQLRERTRMAALITKDISGHELTPEESRELAELRARYAADRSGEQGKP